MHDNFCWGTIYKSIRRIDMWPMKHLDHINISVLLLNGSSDELRRPPSSICGMLRHSDIITHVMIIRDALYHMVDHPTCHAMLGHMR